MALPPVTLGGYTITHQAEDRISIQKGGEAPIETTVAALNETVNRLSHDVHGASSSGAADAAGHLMAIIQGTVLVSAAESDTVIALLTGAVEAERA